MKHLDLFSGIGGFALAARWMGWGTVQFVEIDKFCQKVLNKNFPNIPIHGDIKTFDGSKYRGTVDILTGGFPCQPFSLAGKQKGKDDNRYLWPEFIRTIRDVKPSYVVCENVPGFISMAFETVCADLEGEGYKVEAFIIPACALDAPHRRERIWIIAYTDCNDARRCGYEKIGCEEEESEGQQNQRKRFWPVIERVGKERATTNAIGQRLEVGQLESNGKEFAATLRSNNQWKNWPTVAAICRRDDGVPNRVDRIKSLGNAIVPQVAFEIFKAIEQSF